VVKKGKGGENRRCGFEENFWKGKLARSDGLRFGKTIRSGIGKCRDYLSRKKPSAEEVQGKKPSGGLLRELEDLQRDQLCEKRIRKGMWNQIHRRRLKGAAFHKNNHIRHPTFRDELEKKY